jgi:hypothetical protein
MEMNIAEKISLPWYKVWIDALTRPSVAVYESFLQDIHATSQRAYVWLIISGLIVGLISALTDRAASVVIRIICDPLFPGIVVVFSITIIAGLVQFLAQVIGGMGTYSKLIYALAAFNAPMTIISSFLLFIPYGLWVNAALGIYWVVLSAIAVKAVHQLEWRKAIIAILPVILLAILLIVVTPLLIRLLASRG